LISCASSSVSEIHTDYKNNFSACSRFTAGQFDVSNSEGALAVWTYDRVNFWLFTDTNPGVGFPKSPFRVRVLELSNSVKKVVSAQEEM
jgi:hypothetical protein